MLLFCWTVHPLRRLPLSTTLIQNVKTDARFEAILMTMLFLLKKEFEVPYVATTFKQQ
jgi:hypothetical protein